MRPHSVEMWFTSRGTTCVRQGTSSNYVAAASTPPALVQAAHSSAIPSLVTSRPAVQYTDEWMRAIYLDLERRMADRFELWTTRPGSNSKPPQPPAV